MTHAATRASGRSRRMVGILALSLACILAPGTASAAVQAHPPHAELTVTKTADQPFVEVNRTGVTSPRSVTWSISVSRGSYHNASNVDVIDVLPAPSRAGNDFHGTMRFDSATVTAGENIAIRYTKTASGSLSADARHASNLATGATVWCDAPAGGAVVSGAGVAADCPQSAAEVTGLRMFRPGSFGLTDPFRVSVAMTPIGNRSGDGYRNFAAGRADGTFHGVASAMSDVSVVASSVGDTVWIDADADGVQGQGEVGLAGVTVRLVGTDTAGNEVRRATLTNGSGSYLFDEVASGSYTVEFDLSNVPGYAFTAQGVGADPARDSNADPFTGRSATFQLGVDTDELTIDAGVVSGSGGLVINKQLVGAGVRPFAGDDELTFSVVCVSGADTVFTEDVALHVNDRSVVTSDVLGPIVAGAECTVTETEPGNADPDVLPDPVTVTIGADHTDAPSIVTASLTNYYSAGTLQVTKQLAGDRVAMAAAENRVFKLRLSCEIEEPTASNARVRASLYSGEVKIRGGQTKYLADAAGDPRALPLGARCFATETDDGGAASSKVDYTSWDNAAEVISGTPETMQSLEITAVNTFVNATLRVEKRVTGTGTGGAYSFGLVCTIPGRNAAGEPIDAAYKLPSADAKFTLRAGQSRTITLPAGVTCQATETAVPKGATVVVHDTDARTLGGATDGIVAKLQGSANSVIITNDFTRNSGSGGGGTPGDGSGSGGPGVPGELGGGAGGPAGSGADGSGTDGAGVGADGGLALTGTQTSFGVVLLGLGALVLGTSLLTVRRRPAA